MPIYGHNITNMPIYGHNILSAAHVPVVSSNTAVSLNQGGAVGIVNWIITEDSEIVKTPYSLQCRLDKGIRISITMCDFLCLHNLS